MWVRFDIAAITLCDHTLHFDRMTAREDGPVLKSLLSRMASSWLAVIGKAALRSHGSCACSDDIRVLFRQYKVQYRPPSSLRHSHLRGLHKSSYVLSIACPGRSLVANTKPLWWCPCVL
jgi:hypothetical protein